MSLGNTLRDIANESALEKDERYSLRQIAREYDKLKASHTKLVGLLGRLYDHASYEDAGEWILEDKSLQHAVNQVLKKAEKIT